MGALSLDAAGSSAAPRWRTLVAGVDLARAAAPDTIVFAKGSELDAIAFDPIRMAAAGAPRAVMAPVATTRGRANYALSATGSLVAAVPPAPSSPPVAPGLTWWSPSGFQAAADEVRRLRGANLSPEGTRVAGVNRRGRPRRRLGDRRRSRHRDTPDAQRNQLIADLVRRWPDHLLCVTHRRRVRDLEPRHGRNAGGDAPLFRRECFAALAPAGGLARRHDARLPPDRAAEEARTSGCCRSPAVRRVRSCKGRSMTARRASRRTRRWSHSSRPKRAAGKSTSNASATDAASSSRPTAASGHIWARDGLYFQSRGQLVRASVADEAGTLRVGPGRPDERRAGRDAPGRFP